MQKDETQETAPVVTCCQPQTATTHRHQEALLVKRNKTQQHVEVDSVGTTVGNTINQS